MHVENYACTQIGHLRDRQTDTTKEELLITSNRSNYIRLFLVGSA